MEESEKGCWFLVCDIPKADPPFDSNKEKKPQRQRQRQRQRHGSSRNEVEVEVDMEGFIDSKCC